MKNKHKNDLIKYCIRHMSSKDLIHSFFNSHKIKSQIRNINNEIKYVGDMIISVMNRINASQKDNIINQQEYSFSNDELNSITNMYNEIISTHTNTTSQ